MESVIGVLLIMVAVIGGAIYFYADRKRDSDSSLSLKDSSQTRRPDNAGSDSSLSEGGESASSNEDKAVDAEEDIDPIGTGTKRYDPKEEPRPTSNSADRYCSECGEGHGGDADFCSECGNPIVEDRIYLRIDGEILKLPYDESVGKRLRQHLIETDHSEFSARHISRDHCKFSRTTDGVSLVDLDSTHGTVVNGLEVASGEPTEISEGDRIEFAGVVTATVVAV